MSWFKDKYGTQTPQEAPDVDVENAVAEYGKAHEENPIMQYFTQAQPAFKWAMSGMPQDLEGIEKAEKSSWADIIGQAYPSVGESPSVAVQFTKEMMGDVLDLASRPSTYIAPKVIEKGGGILLKKLAEMPAGRKILEKHLPNMAKGVLEKTAPNAAETIAPAVETSTEVAGEIPKDVKTYYMQGVETPKYAENINLETMPQDVRQKLYDVVSNNPNIGITPKISNAELISKAQEIKDTPIINYLTNLPEGSLETEALKLRMGNTQLLRDALKTDLTDLKGSLDAIMSTDIAKQRKVASIFGRGLQQQTISPEAQQELAFTIDDKIKMIKRDPAFGQDKELIGTLEKLRDTVVDPTFNPTAWNKVYYAWLNSILSSPMTHIVNTTSNTLFALAKLPEKFASATMDLPISLFTGKRTHFFGEIPAMIKGAVSKEKLPQELAQAGSKLEVFSKPIKGTAGKVVGLPTQLLQLEDNLAKNVVGKMELYAQRYAGKTGDELLEAVKNEQLYRTFQNEPTALARGLMNLRAKVPFVKYVVPFIKTPANIIERGLERTPLVLGKIAYKGAKGTYTQEELAKDMGLLSMSSMLTGYIAWQVGKGNIVGNAPEDKAARDAFFRQGKKPNSIRIGDDWIPLDRLEPFGTAFATITNLIQSYKQSNKDIPPEKAMDAVASLGKTLSNKTYLSGMTGLLKSMSDPEMYGAGFFRRLASGSVPNVLSFFAQLKDPYYRQADSILDYMKMKVPYLSETLEPKLNAFGEEVKREPLNIGKANESQLEQGLQETPVGFPSKKIGDVKLTTKEYNDLLKDTGGKIRAYLERITAHPQWKTLPVEQREKIIENLASKVRKEARARIREQHESDFKNWASKVKPQPPQPNQMPEKRFKSKLAKKYGGKK